MWVKFKNRRIKCGGGGGGTRGSSVATEGVGGGGVGRRRVSEKCTYESIKGRGMWEARKDSSAFSFALLSRGSVQLLRIESLSYLKARNVQREKLACMLHKTRCCVW